MAIPVIFLGPKIHKKCLSQKHLFWQAVIKLTLKQFTWLQPTAMLAMLAHQIIVFSFMLKTLKYRLIPQTK